MKMKQQDSWLPFVFLVPVGFLYFPGACSKHYIVCYDAPVKLFCAQPPGSPEVRGKICLRLEDFHFRILTLDFLRPPGDTCIINFRTVNLVSINFFWE